MFGSVVFILERWLSRFYIRDFPPSSPTLATLESFLQVGTLGSRVSLSRSCVALILIRPRLLHRATIVSISHPKCKIILDSQMTVRCEEKEAESRLLSNGVDGSDCAHAFGAANSNNG